MPVKAAVANVESFSVHADRKEIVSWLSHIANPTQTFIVHGERESQEAIKTALEGELGWKATIPELEKTYEVR